MVRSIWTATLLTAWAWAGSAWAQPKVAPAPATAEGAGPVTTICEPGTPEGAPERPVRGFLNRLFHRRGEACSAGSCETAVPVTATPPANEMHFKKNGVVTADMKSGDTAIMGKQSAMSSAPVSQPGDWRQSWGKADDHKSAGLPHAASGRFDPLKSPEAFALGAMDKKVADINPASNDVAGDAAVTGQVESDVFTPASPGSIPYGAGSVWAAGGGAPGEVVYVPVPVVTVPQVRPHAPAGPPPRPPQPVRPPQGPPNGAIANAFATLEPGDPDANGMPAPDLVDANAFSQRPMPAQLRTNGFTNIRNPDPDYPAFGTSGMTMMAAYPPPRSPAGYAGQYPMLAGAAMGVPNSPGPVSGTPPANVMGVAQASYARAASNSAGLLATLREALYPSQREYAAECLAASETKANTQVVEALMIAAKSDPAATVRAACVRCLTKMNVSGPGMIAMLNSLKTDVDPRVRQAAEQALAKLQ